VILFHPRIIEKIPKNNKMNTEILDTEQIQPSISISDSATTEDLLNFKEFAIPISERIAAATDDSTPMTIGVYGEWGSGKTSFLLMVDEALRKKSVHPVWFNAWKYEKENDLWVALIQTILDQATVNGNWLQRAWVKLKLWKDNISLRSGALEILKKVLPVIFRCFVVFFCFVLLFGYSAQEIQIKLEHIFTQWFQNSPDLITFLSVRVVQAIVILISFVAAKPDAWIKFFDPKLGIDFSKLKEKKTYREHIAFLDQFSSEFEHIIRLVGHGKPLVVIIDDLDRCLPESALQILEAIKLFLDVKKCVFLLAVDREVVEKAIAVKYKDLLEIEKITNNQSENFFSFLGENYFDKIIHLAIPVPPLSENQVKLFLNELYSDDDVKMCAKIFSTGLPRNPRKIKRILQNFLFLRDLSLKSKETINIEPSLLAKFVVIQNQFRDVYREVVKNPIVLEEIERYCIKKLEAYERGETVVDADIENISLKAIVETYANQDLLLQEVLLERVSEKDSFIGERLEDYVFLLRSVSEDSFARSSTEDILRTTSRDKIIDFFISYQSSDKKWAEWIAWHLEGAGYQVIISAWDFRPGSNFVLDFQQLAGKAQRTIAVISQSYLDSLYSQSEWASSFAQDPTGEKGILIPVVVQECEFKGLLGQIVYIDLVGLPENEAVDLLLRRVKQERAKPQKLPSFPG